MQRRRPMSRRVQRPSGEAFPKGPLLAACPTVLLFPQLPCCTRLFFLWWNQTSPRLGSPGWEMQLLKHGNPLPT